MATLPGVAQLLSRSTARITPEHNLFCAYMEGPIGLTDEQMKHLFRWTKTNLVVDPRRETYEAEVPVRDYKRYDEDAIPTKTVKKERFVAGHDPIARVGDRMHVIRIASLVGLAVMARLAPFLEPGEDPIPFLYELLVAFGADADQMIEHSDTFLEED
jgi:hypothetical protein